jgi:hypothetical protein
MVELVSEADTGGNPGVIRVRKKSGNLDPDDLILARQAPGRELNN